MDSIWAVLMRLRSRASSALSLSAKHLPSVDRWRCCSAGGCLSCTYRRRYTIALDPPGDRAVHAHLVTFTKLEQLVGAEHPPAAGLRVVGADRWAGVRDRGDRLRHCAARPHWVGDDI